MTPKSLILTLTSLLLAATQSQADTFNVSRGGERGGRGGGGHEVPRVTPNPPRYPGPGGGGVRPGPSQPRRPDPTPRYSPPRGGGGHQSGPSHGGGHHSGPIYRSPGYYPAPVYPAPIYPAPVYPVPVYPSNPYPVDQYSQRTISINRYVANETLYIREMTDLISYYRGYTVESVDVDISQSGGSTLQLQANGYTEDTSYSPYGLVTLYPGNNRVVGYSLTSLAVRIDGSAYINRITINLRRD